MAPTDTDTKPNNKRKRSSSPKVKTEVKAAVKGETRAYNKWTSTEKKALLTHIDTLVKQHIWDAVKGDPRFKARGSTGVRGQWKSMVKQLESSL